jgi:eukaryotic-like serine/threonine-protein kinase
MSRVFLAEETRLGRRVVIKVLSPDLGASLSAERFEREVKLAARLQHPHIVPLIAAGDVDGLPYYTMPYVAGASLRERMLAGPISSHDAQGILRDVAKALAYAHRQGIVHRDIKPENVLLNEGTAMVADFGVARALRAASTLADGGGTLTQMGT